MQVTERRGVECISAFFVQVSCSYHSCKYVKRGIPKYTLLTTWLVLCSSTWTCQPELYLHLGRFFTQLFPSSLASGPSGCMTSTAPPLPTPPSSWLMNPPPHTALQIWLYSWSRPRWKSAELLSLAGTGTLPCHCGPAPATIKGKTEWVEGQEDETGTRRTQMEGGGSEESIYSPPERLNQWTPQKLEFCIAAVQLVFVRWKKTGYKLIKISRVPDLVFCGTWRSVTYHIPCWLHIHLSYTQLIFQPLQEDSSCYGKGQQTTSVKVRTDIWHRD